MESNSKSSILWGKQLSEIPCFRDSYIYGISGGVAAGLIYFMFTSKTRLSTHVAFSAFTITTLGYWTYCRYNWERDERTAALMKEFLKDRIAKEGTERDVVIVHDVANKPSSV